jgi:hypothetical protein
VKLAAKWLLSGSALLFNAWFHCGVEVTNHTNAPMSES